MLLDATSSYRIMSKTSTTVKMRAVSAFGAMTTRRYLQPATSHEPAFDPTHLVLEQLLAIQLGDLLSVHQNASLAALVRAVQVDLDGLARELVGERRAQLRLHWRSAARGRDSHGVDYLLDQHSAATTKASEPSGCVTVVLRDMDQNLVDMWKRWLPAAS